MELELSFFWPWLAVGAGFTALLLAMGHWAPWEPPLPILGRYVYGVSAILIGFIVWRMGANDPVTSIGLLAVAATGGGTVWLCYRIDAFVIKLRKARKAERDDDELGQS